MCIQLYRWIARLQKRVAPLVASVALLPTTIASATTLSPGGAAPLVGDNSGGGTIIRDELIYFEIRDVDTSILFAGWVQDRVMKRPDGALTFSKRIRDTLVDVEGAVGAFSVDGYYGLITDVEWELSGSGSNVPDWGLRDGTGNDLSFLFFTNPIHETEESRFAYARTDAFAYAVDGDMTIQLETGESTTVTVARPDTDLEPVAILDEPGPFQCLCNPGTISGIADAGGGYVAHWIEYRPIADPTWALLLQSTTPVSAPGGLLATWNTGALTQGYYMVRLSVESINGAIATAETIVWIDHTFDNFSYAGPADNQVLGGTVCTHGIINDHCAETYAVDYSDGGPFLPVDPGMPIYVGPKINQTFATWDSTTVPDGPYSIRVQAWDDCGHTDFDTRQIIIDNTVPTASIGSPTDCECVEGIVEIIGTADDANLASWVLSYWDQTQQAWVTINTGVDPVINGVLGTWDTTTLPTCAHTLRLVVSDEAIVNCNGAVHHHADFVITVDVGCKGCPGDLDNSGDVSTPDLLMLLSFWGLCP